MARINIEDSLFKDRRFQKLVAKVGDPDLALGIVVRSFCVAQKYWIRFGSIPVLEWQKEGLSDALIEVGLATVVDSKFVYVHGSKEQFKWLSQRSNAGKVKSPNKGHVNTTKVENTEEFSQRLATEQNGSQPPTPSLSPTLFSDSSSTTYLHPTKKTGGGATTKIWESYAKAYEARYRVPPKRNATTNGQAMSLLKRLGETDAIAVVRFYLAHNDRWYVRHGHSMGLCLKDCEKLFMEWKSDSRVTSVTAAKVETTDHNLNVVKNYLKRTEQLTLEREVHEDPRTITQGRVSEALGNSGRDLSAHAGRLPDPDV